MPLWPAARRAGVRAVMPLWPAARRAGVGAVMQGALALANGHFFPLTDWRTARRGGAGGPLGRVCGHESGSGLVELRLLLLVLIVDLAATRGHHLVGVDHPHARVMVMVVPLVLLVFVLLLISLLLARVGAATVEVALQILGLALRRRHARDTLGRGHL